MKNSVKTSCKTLKVSAAGENLVQRVKIRYTVLGQNLGFRNFK